MTFKLIVLGCNSAKPILTRHPSAYVLNINDNLFLIDCGEGTQIQFLKYKIKISKINHIFISHLHGDHYLGLMGIIDSFALNNRTKPLYIYGVPKLAEIIKVHFEATGSSFNGIDAPFPIIFRALHENIPEVILNNDEIIVKTIVLEHRVPCLGFLFTEKPKLRKILPDKILQYNVPKTFIKQIKEGADFITANGQIVLNNELTTNPPNSNTFAYCSDTLYSEKVIEQIKDVDLLFHEATYLKDLTEKAYNWGHSTAEQAATVAKKANAKKLILGHFSSKYANTQLFLDEAKTIFEHTYLAQEGESYSLY